MTNDELKKKIVGIILKTAYKYVSDSTAEEIADALIAAGIGDVKEVEFDNYVLKQTNMFSEARYKSSEEDRQYWINKWKKTEHRAEVAEKQVYCLARSFAEALCKNGNAENLTQGFIQDAQKQAEKELAEEGKDEQS